MGHYYYSMQIVNSLPGNNQSNILIDYLAHDVSRA